MPSLRSSGLIIGSSVSIRQLAKPYKLPKPLSVRQLMAAMGIPNYQDAGIKRQRLLPLALFQRKFDEFVNLRERMLFQVRLSGSQFGENWVFVHFEDEVYGTRRLLTKKRIGGKFVRINDLGTDRIRLTMGSPQPGAPAEIGIEVEFETKGVEPEIQIEWLPDVNIKKLKFNFAVPLMLDGEQRLLNIAGFDDLVKQALLGVQYKALDSRLMLAVVEFRGKVFKATGSVGAKASLRDDLRVQLYKEFIRVDIDFDWVPGDSLIIKKVEKLFTDIGAAILVQLAKGRRTASGHEPGLNRYLSEWLLGKDTAVVGAWCDGSRLLIDYLGGEQRPPIPETPQAPLPPGRLANIDHIVVLMMENRSFDHMLGYLSKEGGADGRIRSDIDGLNGNETNSYNGVDYPSFPLPGTLFIEDPCHGFTCVKTQVNWDDANPPKGRMDGFVTSFAEKFAAKGTDPGKVMGYYQAPQVPVFDALAREFMVCDRWFCAHPGPTFPNRFYQVTGRLSRNAANKFEVGNPKFSGGATLADDKTIFEHLSAAGVSWRYYEHGYGFLRLFDRYVFDNDRVLDARDPEHGFYAAARNGTLPAVTFIDPDFIDAPPGADDHPPTDIGHGQRLIGEVVNALMAGPGWDKTLLIITYDEHGGFFDHVSPPRAPLISGAATTEGMDRYGPRVPALVVSPWVERGSVAKETFDHTSILKTIAKRFLPNNPPDMGERMAQANDLEPFLRASPRGDRPAIPVPPAPAVPVRPVPDFWEGADDEDFHAMLFRRRYQFFAGSTRAKEWDGDGDGDTGPLPDGGGPTSPK
ncbi:phospholipase C [Methylomonas koyamae]|uniref:phospholipase C n=1 Tax=Methylomonas koyamae TaxID=702114 RepID=UPI00112C376D|nr:alkaline phosphatase family protein [Methylomonas koyamae]TPQ27376.1 hypothetical protein C2U68_08830 [Methylomonas koyamae]